MAIALAILQSTGIVALVVVTALRGLTGLDAGGITLILLLFGAAGTLDWPGVSALYNLFSTIRAYRFWIASPDSVSPSNGDWPVIAS